MRDLIWATTAARLHSLRLAFTEHSAAATALLSAEAREGGRTRLEAAVSQRKASASMIQVLPLLGDITQRGGFYGTSADLYGQAFSQAVADPAVAAIVMEVDSPGGEVHGVDELASRIRAARGTKPIVASINTMATSAAYWVASQADEVIASTSSGIGGIGVFSVFEDWSRAIDQMGVTLTLISAGEGKGLDQPGLAMTDELRAEIQGRVDSYYAMFVGAVAKGRGVREAKVRDSWKARTVGASEGVDLGMADSIGTIDDAIVRAGVLSRKRGATRAEVDVEVEARIRQRARA